MDDGRPYDYESDDEWMHISPLAGDSDRDPSICCNMGCIEPGVVRSIEWPNKYMYCIEHSMKHEREAYLATASNDLDEDLASLQSKWAGREQDLWAYYGRPLALSSVVKPL